MAASISRVGPFSSNEHKIDTMIANLVIKIWSWANVMQTRLHLEII